VQEGLWQADVLVRTYSSWLTVLRRVPVLRQFMPTPQRLHWGAEATYRVQIHAVPAGACTSLPCYEALLLDVAPDSP
jgi:hypothetical protein